VSWCRNKYDIELIEKRIQNITNYFMSMGLNKDRISQNISMNGDKDCDEAYLRVFSLDNNSPSRTVSPNAQEEESPGKKKLVPQDKVALKELADVLSKTEITFDSNKDIPKIVDYNDNINRTVEILKEHPSFGLQIEGYTCGQGSEEHNRDLASRRADRVMQIFIEKGVSPAQISKKTYTVNDPGSNNPPHENREPCDIAVFRLLVN
jgi:outer membrane protein OmpA-like peptidoglycan-associated protein